MTASKNCFNCQNRHNKWVEEVQEASLGSVDMGGATRDMLLQIKDNARELQSSLRTLRVGKVDVGGGRGRASY